jgi:hypothetical protein
LRAAISVRKLYLRSNNCEILRVAAIDMYKSMHAEGDCVQLTGEEHDGQTYPAGAVWVGKFWMCDIKHFVCITSIIIKETIYSCMNEFAFVK